MKAHLQLLFFTFLDTFVVVFPKVRMKLGLCHHRDVMGLGNIIGLSRMSLFTIIS